VCTPKLLLLSVAACISVYVVWVVRNQYITSCGVCWQNGGRASEGGTIALRVLTDNNVECRYNVSNTH